MVPFVCTIVKLILNITNANHEAMNATKKSFPADDHATMFNLLTHFDFDSVSSQITLIYIFNIAKL